MGMMKYIATARQHGESIGEIASYVAEHSGEPKAKVAEAIRKLVHNRRCGKAVDGNCD